jgi:hypothetical protein
MTVAPPPNDANVTTLPIGLNMDQAALLFNVNPVPFAESVNAVALENMFINKLVPETNVKAEVGGVKFAVYNAVPLTMRTPPMKPVKKVVAPLYVPSEILAALGNV